MIDKLRKWLDENNYEDFSIINVGSISLECKRKISKDDIERLNHELGLKLKYCWIYYENPFEKNNISKIEYNFETKEYSKFNDEIRQWLDNHGLSSLNFIVFSSYIKFYGNDKLSEEIIQELENEFNIQLKSFQLGYNHSSESFKRYAIDYIFNFK